MTRRRLVSVVVPTRDRPEFLRQALASIRAAEGDDLECEILVGDNGTAPETPQIAAEFGARYLRAEREGAGAARNVGLSAATGEFVAFLDDDDVWTPQALRAQLKMLDADPEIDAVFGQVVCVDHDLKPTGHVWPEEALRGDELLRRMLSGYFPQIGATVARAEAARANGLLDESLIGDQDWDWQLRLARSRRAAIATELCVLFRQRPPGTYDALMRRRFPFTRRVFWRYATCEHRLWRTPIGLLKSYRGTLWVYYDYFSQSARLAAARGDSAGARAAIWGAMRAVPDRAIALAASAPIRSVLLRSSQSNPDLKQTAKRAQ